MSVEFSPSQPAQKIQATPSCQSACTPSTTFSQNADSSLQSSAPEEGFIAKIKHFLSIIWDRLSYFLCCKSCREYTSEASPSLQHSNNSTLVNPPSNQVYYNVENPVSMAFLRLLRDSVCRVSSGPGRPLERVPEVHIKDEKTGVFKEFWNYLVIEQDGKVIFQTKLKSIPCRFSGKLKTESKEFYEFNLADYMKEPGKSVVGYYAVVTEENHQGTENKKLFAFVLELEALQGVAPENWKTDNYSTTIPLFLPKAIEKNTPYFALKPLFDYILQS